MTKKIMIQGTGSSVGKTLITAGLCRIFTNDNYKVCPFKSQNMALNSFIDINGNELSRATVLQAYGAKVIPLSYMNPILLKPIEDNKSQLIINGKAIKNIDAIDYFKNTKFLKKDLKNIFDINIENKYDICVLEGGGSPAEINLREFDIVNMGMAEIVDTDVILVANIEIGGVFASIYGTVALLDEKDRKRIKGYIINKFRGEEKLLESGIKILDDKFKKLNLDIKCLGVIPLMKINLEEEDSLSNSINKKNDFASDKINIAIIKIDKISNFTDFYCFDIYDDVAIKYINRSEELGDEDVIILPGSKSTISDLKKLKENGIFEKIIEEEKKGKIVVGICAGLQMCGKKIKDPYHLESYIEEESAFNFFDYETILEKLKITKQNIYKIPKLNGILQNFENYIINGYEIHQGRTNINYPFLSKDNIFVTYIHGIFDSDKFRNDFLNAIRVKKNMKIVFREFEKYKEEQFHILEKTLREHLNLEEIYKILR